MLILSAGPAVKERDEKERPGTAELLRSGCRGMETDIGAETEGKVRGKRGWRELGESLGGGKGGRLEENWEEARSWERR